MQAAGEAPHTVVMVAGQPQTRVGAHRMFVELARTLASRGVASLRFDCSGWGDSPGSAQTFEASRYDVLSIVQALLNARPSHPLSLLGLCDGATAACLSLPLLKADHRALSTIFLLNPWIESKQFEARAKLTSYYAERLKSREFWTKLARGQVSVGSAVGGALRSVKDSQQGTSTDDGSVSERLLTALSDETCVPFFVLSEPDLTAQTFMKWADGEPRLKHFLTPQNTLRLVAADHTFSNPKHWEEVCEWVALKVLAASKNEVI
jgi:uncharacterized protein